MDYPIFFANIVFVNCTQFYETNNSDFTQHLLFYTSFRDE